MKTEATSLICCTDVQQVLFAHLQSRLQYGDCLVHLGCHRGDLAYRVQSLVGSAGRVIGLEADNEYINDLLRSHPQRIAEAEWDNVFFYHFTGKDLRIDQFRLKAMLRKKAVENLEQLQVLLARMDRYFDANPVIEDSTADHILLTENLPQLTSTALTQLASDIARVLTPRGQCTLLLPVSQTRLNQQKMVDFLHHLQQLGLVFQKVTEHQLNPRTCSENHYLLLVLRPNLDVASSTSFLQEKINQLFDQVITDSACSAENGCC